MIFLVYVGRKACGCKVAAATPDNLETIGNQFDDAKDKADYLKQFSKELRDEFGSKEINRYET